MDKIIPFNKGIHRRPSVGVDGELSELVNLVPVNGELKNVRGMERYTESAYEESLLVYIHAVQGADNLVFTSTTSRGLIYERDGAQEAIVENLENFKSITSVGNTLVVLDGENTRYFIWRGSKYVEYDFANAGFKVLIESEINEEWSYAVKDDINYDKKYAPGFAHGDKHTLSPDQLDYLYQLADTKINQRMSGLDEPNKWHKYVTFGIAALRLFGESESYAVYTDIFTLDPKVDMLQGYIEANSDSSLSTMEVQTLLSKYKVTVECDFIDGEIVTGIDFFLTQPYSFIKHNNEKTVQSSFTSIFDKMSLEEMQEELSSLVFRKAYSIKKEDFTNNQYTFEIPKASDGEKELGIADIPSYVFCSEKMFPYNGRLNLVGNDTYLRPMRKGHCTQKVITGSGSIAAPAGGFVDSIGYYNQDTGEYEHHGEQMIYEGVADIVIRVDCEDDTYGSVTNWYYEENAYYPPPPVLSYPSRNVTNMTMYMRYKSSCFSLDLNRLRLKPQKLINGNLSLFFFGKYPYPYEEDTLWDGGLEDEDFERVLNKAKNHSRRIGSEINTVKYSEYGKPFILPPVNSIQVGNEKIVGASTFAKALSQGQFGQFPVSIFCSDGIWALEVGSDGSYTSVTPVSRDVCNNPDSITQIDGAVVFTTDQGLMMIQGSEVVNLSGAMEGYNVDESIYFPERFFEGFDKEEFDHIVVSEKRDFREILKTCTIAYDYVNQLLRIFPKREDEKDSTHPYKYYVYSLTTREFASVVSSEFEVKNGESETYSEVKAVVPDYPSSIVQIGDALYRPSERDDNKNTRKGLLLTRPMMLDEPFALKKLQDMRLHYSKFDGTSKCNVIVYVSNDGNHWMQLKSLRRKAYKYYRFAIITEMKDMDALSGMVLRYELERTNKLR